MDELAFLAAVFVSIFALVDPIGTLPFYVALTEGFEASDRSIIVRRATLVLVAVLSGFALVGRFLFSAFGFTLQAFEIAGGILLFAVAFDMMQGEATRTRLAVGDAKELAGRRDEVAVVPLGIPLLAGPGAISTVMIYEGYAGNDPIGLAATFVGIAVAGVSTFIVLEYGQGIFRRLGRVAILAMTRVLGLVLAAVAVQFVINGIVAVIAHV